jgi:hypothetical protein
MLPTHQCGHSMLGSWHLESWSRLSSAKTLREEDLKASVAHGTEPLREDIPGWYMPLPANGIPRPTSNKEQVGG